MFEIIKEDYKHWGAIGALEKASAGNTCRAGNIRLPYIPFSLHARQVSL